MTGPWIGVDLDGTLAHYDSKQGVRFVGKPIAKMVERVKAWLAEGKRVKILTARACGFWGEEDRLEQVEMIQSWCEEHLGRRIEVTALKDFEMVELWDDRAIGVIKNTGVSHLDANEEAYSFDKVLPDVDPVDGCRDSLAGFEPELLDEKNRSHRPISVRTVDAYGPGEGDSEDEFYVSPREARRLASQLLRAADEADEAIAKR